MALLVVECSVGGGLQVFVFWGLWEGDQIFPSCLLTVDCARLWELEVDCIVALVSAHGSMRTRHRIFPCALKPILALLLLLILNVNATCSSLVALPPGRCSKVAHAFMLHLLLGLDYLSVQGLQLAQNFINIVIRTLIIFRHLLSYKLCSYSIDDPSFFGLIGDVDKVAMAFVVRILIMEDGKVRRKLILFYMFLGLAGGRMKMLSSLPFPALAFDLFL